MTDFWVFLAKVPLALTGLVTLTALIAFLTATPDLQTQLAALVGGE
jgi:hypothetical protein